MALDPSNPPAQPDASSLLAEVAKLLNVDPTDTDAMQKAFASLIEAADGSAQLNHSELRACKAQGCTPRDFLRAKKGLTGR